MQRGTTGIAVVNQVDAANLLLANPKLQKMLSEMSLVDTHHTAAGGVVVNGSPHTRDANAVDTACLVKVSTPLAVTAGALPLAVAAPLKAPLGGVSHSALEDGQRFVKVPASVLKTLPGLDKLAVELFEGKYLRQLGRGQVDVKGKDVSGFFVVADGGAVVLFNTAKDGRQWANNKNQVNIQIAPSLTCVNSGHSSVSLFEFQTPREETDFGLIFEQFDKGSKTLQNDFNI